MRALYLGFCGLASLALGAAPDTPINVITLERTSCFSRTCPTYTLTVRRDGLVIYDGRESVKVMGHQSHRISGDRFRQLAHEIHRIGFFSFQDEYLRVRNPDGSFGAETDLPTTITTVRAGKTRKSIRNYYGGPEALARLEKLIDKLTESGMWTGR